MKKIRKHYLLILIIFGIAAMITVVAVYIRNNLPPKEIMMLISSEGDFQIEELQTNFVNEPYGIDESPILFSWKITNAPAGFVQSAYRLMVWRKDTLSEEKTLVWDSKKVNQNQTVGIPYQGKAEDNTAYEWQVCVYDNNEQQAVSAPAAFTTGFMEQSPFEDAHFVSMAPEESVYEEGQPIFLKSFATKEVPVKKAVIYATALGIYDAYLNGQRIGNDELKPGWTDYEKTLLYNTYDVTDAVLSGEDNFLASMVGTGWWCGRVSQGTYGYNQTAFLCKLMIYYEDGTSETIVTDDSWRYYKNSAVVSADIYNGEVFDANKIQTAEAATAEGFAKFAVSNWYLPVHYNNCFAGEFRAYYGKNVRIRKELNQSPAALHIYNGITSNSSTYGAVHTILEVSEQAQSHFPLELKKGETLILDFGKNITAVPYLKVNAGQNTEIKLHFAEMLNDSGEESRGNDGPAGSLYRANYRSAQSEVTYIASGKEAEEYRSTFTYFGFRYASVEASEDITVLDFAGEFIGLDSEARGSIKTDNPKVNQLFQNLVNSQQGNFLLVATDCPQRDERFGWTGDLQVYCQTALYNEELYQFFKKWCRDCRDSQREDGSYTDAVPHSAVLGSGNAGWSDAGIIIPYLVYREYGDKTILEDMYPSMVKYMDYLQQFGLNGPQTAFGDWLAYDVTDAEYVSVAYYAKDAMYMSQIAEILGKKDDVPKYNQLYNEIKASFAERYIKDNHLTVQTQTGCLLALENGLVEGIVYENTKEDLNLLIEQNQGKLSTGFLGTPVLLPVLAENNMLETAYRLLLQEENPSWLYSVNQGATSMWERWDSYTLENGFQQNGMNSFNHFAYGSVGEWMYEYMLGISVSANKKEADTTFQLRPGILMTENNGNIIRACEGYYDSCYGKVEVSWEILEDKVSYQVTVPPNTSAKLILPLQNGQNSGIMINGVQSTDAEIRLVSGFYNIEYNR